MIPTHQPLVTTAAALSVLLFLPCASKAGEGEEIPLARNGDYLEARVLLPLPRDSRVRDVQVFVDAAAGLSTEEQLGYQSGDVLTLGRTIQREVSFDEGSLKRNDSPLEHQAMFYLVHPASHVVDFSINVTSASGPDGFVTGGRTPPGFRVEAYLVDGMGATRGRRLQVWDDVSFNVGAANRFALNADIPEDRTVAVKVMRARRYNENLAVQIRASSSPGTHPVNLLGTGEAMFDPDVTWTYRERPGASALGGAGGLTHLAEKIQSYLAEARGRTAAVPLRIRIRTR